MARRARRREKFVRAVVIVVGILIVLALILGTLPPS